MDFTLLINVTIVVISGFLVGFAIPWIKEHTTQKQRESLVAWIKIGVAAAEQIYTQSGMGEQKKDYVLEFLRDKGYNIDLEEIDNIIEATVRQLNTDLNFSKGLNID